MSRYDGLNKEGEPPGSPSLSTTHHESVRSSNAGIRVKSRNDEAHSKPCEYHQREAQQRKVSAFPAHPAVRDTRVQESRIRHPRHQRSSFFGVPSPIPAPGLISPHGSCDQQQRQQRECYSYSAI